MAQRCAYTRCRAYCSLTNSERLTTAPAREGFVSVCACTEPAGTGIGAVCVERGRQTWPKKLSNHTHAMTPILDKETMNEAPYSRATRCEEALALGNPRKKGSRASLLADQPQRRCVQTYWHTAVLFVADTRRSILPVDSRLTLRGWLL